MTHDSLDSLDVDISQHQPRPACVPQCMKVELFVLGVQKVTPLATEGYDPAYGARPLKRVIQQRIQNNLAKELLAGNYAENETITVDASGPAFTFYHDGDSRLAG
jgi:hypothetical protein